MRKKLPARSGQRKTFHRCLLEGGKFSVDGFAHTCVAAMFHIITSGYGTGVEGAASQTVPATIAMATCAQPAQPAKNNAAAVENGSRVQIMQ
jgi:hypothetical protein